ncbi:hypothetical protein GWI33_016908 [Rhynchophorus ferrugineus]|uniref:Uncharacterized protein n=1 Tax=Rhynchophorus ferrugineus TaxID=354439 RepID=A0A834HZZ4_RHYFE|nr:hypothetical protein GWI33_016908 [Rhynchophorus ferrugineus]
MQPTIVPRSPVAVRPNTALLGPSCGEGPVYALCPPPRASPAPAPFYRPAFECSSACQCVGERRGRAGMSIVRRGGIYFLFDGVLLYDEWYQRGGKLRLLSVN